jgi:hypothetical protein
MTRKTQIFIVVILALGCFLQVSHAKGRQPEGVQTPDPAAPIPAYNNPYAPRHENPPELNPRGNSNPLPQGEGSDHPYYPPGPPDPQGASGVMPFPDMPGTKSAPATDGGPAAK